VHCVEQLCWTLSVPISSARQITATKRESNFGHVGIAVITYLHCRVPATFGLTNGQNGKLNVLQIEFGICLLRK